MRPVYIFLHPGSGGQSAIAIEVTSLSAAGVTLPVAAHVAGSVSSTLSELRSLVFQETGGPPFCFLEVIANGELLSLTQGVWAV